MPPDPYWDDDCDFADHFDLYPYPEPDDVVDIEDLMDFVISYTNYHDGVPARGSGQFFAVALDPGGAKFAPTHAPVAIEANIPDRLSAGEEVTIAFRLNDPSGILGLHMVFNLSDNLEIVKVNKGEMFNTGEKTFFYKDVNNGSLLIDGVIFSENGFTSQEIAEVTFQAKTDITTFSLDNVEMLVRDANNQDVEAVFNTEITKTVVLPTEFSLGQNYPNPFNPSTSIDLALPVASNYVLNIYNIAGQKVETFSGYSEAGIVNIIWDAADAASGVYFYKVNAGSFEATKKMVLIK
ncbi:MAG TPA: T9SS type A sorting domain-containing protein [candidate division Zixibacteria bacterium]|nr:T9SS type A sorting domain-containing protein [candidate division Zixibacteria bacterium]